MVVKVNVLAPVTVIVRTPLSSPIGMPPSGAANPAISTGSPLDTHEGIAVVVVTVQVVARVAISLRGSSAYHGTQAGAMPLPGSSVWKAMGAFSISRYPSL